MSTFRFLEVFNGEVNGGDTSGMFLGQGCLGCHCFVWIICGLFSLASHRRILCAFGRDFRYPIMGKRLERYLGYKSLKATDQSSWLVEDHEFRWVAAMGHFGILIMFWGMFAPLTCLDPIP